MKTLRLIWKCPISKYAFICSISRKAIRLRRINHPGTIYLSHKAEINAVLRGLKFESDPDIWQISSDFERRRFATDSYDYAILSIIV